MIDLSQHKCKQLAIHCVDFRFVSSLGEALRIKRGNFDLLTYPGASKAIVDRDTRPAMLKAIAILIKLHGIEIIDLIDHLNCGGFGGKESLNDHIVSLRKAANIIQSEFPSLQIHMFVADADPNGKLILHPIKTK